MNVSPFHVTSVCLAPFLDRFFCTRVRDDASESLRLLGMGVSVLGVYLVFDVSFGGLRVETHTLTAFPTFFFQSFWSDSMDLSAFPSMQ